MENQPVVPPSTPVSAQPTEPTPMPVTPQSETPPTPPRKNPLKMVLLFVVLMMAMAAVGAGAYYAGLQQGQQNQLANTPPVTQETEPETQILPEEEGVFCTMDAKICPDGSAVGRVGPNCEFAACPGEAEGSEFSSLLQTYENTKYKYSFSYPSMWVVTGDDLVTQAESDADTVLVFNPADNPSETAFSGVRIEYHGMIGDTSNMERSSRDGHTMYTEQTMHGDNYYINIPDTDQFLYITGASGNTDNEERNQIARQIFESFTFQPF